MPASSSASVTRYLEETTAGTIETDNPQVYRVTGGALSQTVEASEDNELRDDRSRGDSTVVSGSVGGNLDINYSHKTHNDFLEALFAATPVEAGTHGVATACTDAVFDSSAHTIASATAALPTIAPGQWFSITDAHNAANETIFKATSATHTKSLITVDTVVQNVTSDTANSATISTTRLSQGNTTPLRTFTIERELSDISPKQFFTWAGCYVSSLNLNYAIGDKLSGSIGFLGSEAEDQGASTSKFTGLSGGGVSATTTPFFNTVTGTHVLLDGASMGESCVESMSLTVEGGLRERRCIGSGLAASSIGLDPFKISFTANIYFGSTASAALYAKLLTDETLSFTVCLSDSDGNGFAVTMPRCSLTSATVDGGGMGSDVLMSLAADAVRDPTDETMIHFDFLGSTA